MSIADKLTYLNVTKSLLREAINAAGGNLTQETPFREYAGGWLRDQSASLNLDFSKQQYVAKDKVSMFPDRVGFEDIVTFTRASGGGVINSQGEYEWLPPNTPRIDYDPVTGECRGLLIEEQRTNLMRYSSDFANAAWVKTGVSVAGASGNQKISPASPAMTFSGIYQVAGTTSSSTSYSATYVVKSEGWRYIQINMGGAEFGLGYVNFDLQSGAVTAQSAGTAFTHVSIRPTEVGFYELAVSATAAAAGNNYFRLTFIPAADSPRGAAPAGADGVKGVIVLRAQLEAGAFPTSYIPTTGAQVTRAADIASVNELSPWYNSEQGTLFVEAAAVPHVIGVGRGLVAIEQLTAVSSTRSFSVLLGEDGMCDFAHSGAYISPRLDLLPAGSTVKAAVAASGSGATLAQNGQVISTSRPMPSGALDRMWIGAFAAGAPKANMHIRSIRYYPRRLSDSELQEITA